MTNADEKLTREAVQNLLNCAELNQDSLEPDTIEARDIVRAIFDPLPQPQRDGKFIVAFTFVDPRAGAYRQIFKMADGFDEAETLMKNPLIFGMQEGEQVVNGLIAPPIVSTEAHWINF